VKRHEAPLLEQAEEIKMLKHRLSEQEKMLVKLKVKGMYAFCVCMF
jgi:hypothetical protein